MGVIKDLTSQRFGRLVVIKRDFEGEKKYKDKSARWICKCDCGTIKSISSPKLCSGNTKSCGCLNKEMVYERSKKFNKYDLSGDYGVGYTQLGEKFYFDLEDYDKIKGYCWYVNNIGYIVTHEGDKTLLLHRFVMNPNEDEIVDHMYNEKYDNRKCRLRIATKAQNCQNAKTHSNNTSGRTGVSFDKQNGKWKYVIQFNNKRKSKTGFNTFEEAVKAREEAEIKYHKEFRSYEYREKDDE